MHEMGIAVQIVKIVERHLPEGEGTALRSINLVVGGFSGVVPSALHTCLTMLSKNTVLQGAEINIKEVPVEVRCRECDRVSRVGEPPFACSSCGSLSTELLSGREMSVESIEIEDIG